MTEPIVIQITLIDDAIEPLAAIASSMDAVSESAAALTDSVAAVDEANASLAETSGAAAEGVAANTEAQAASAEAAAANAEATTAEAAALDEMAASAEAASLSLEGLNSAAETALGGGGALMGLLGIAAVGEVASKLNEMGTEVYRTGVALDTLSHGHADEFMKAMQASTHGMVDEETLATSATLALSTGVATTSEQLAEMTRIGTVLGDTFEGSASQGIQDYVRILEMPGASRGLKQLGLDATEVMDKYKADMQAGMDKTTAWADAVGNIAGTQATKLQDAIENGPGSAMDKLNASLKNFGDHAGEWFATGANNILTSASQLNTIISTTETVVNDILAAGQAKDAATQAAKVKAMTGETSPDIVASTSNGQLVPVYSDDGTIAYFVATNDKNKYSQAQAAALPHGTTAIGDVAGVNAPIPVYQGLSSPISPASMSNPQFAGTDAYVWSDGTVHDTPEPGTQGGQAPGPFGGTAPFAYSPPISFGAGGVDYSGSRPRNNTVSGQYGDVSSDSSAGAQAFIQTQIQGVDAASQLRTLVGNIGTGWYNIAEGVNNATAGIVEQSQELEAQRKAEVTATGTVDKGFATARQQLIATDQSSATGRQKEVADLAAFDAAAAKAMDEYALSTGQATKASLDLRDSEGQLVTMLGEGRITSEQYTADMKALIDAMANGEDPATAMAKIIADLNKPINWNDQSPPAVVIPPPVLPKGYTIDDNGTIHGPKITPFEYTTEPTPSISMPTTAAEGQNQKENALLGSQTNTGLTTAVTQATDLNTQTASANTNLSNIATLVAKTDFTPLKTASDHTSDLDANAILATKHLGEMVNHVNALKSGGGQYTFTFQYAGSSSSNSTRNVPGTP